MISVDQAIAIIMKAARPLPSERLGLLAATGRIAACDLQAGRDQPPEAVSAMDGYAISHKDFATYNQNGFALVAEIPAGKAWDGQLLPGQTARIFTGAVLPAGADCVVIQENAYHQAGLDDATPALITFKDAPKRGAWVRPAGLDFKKGDQVLSQGEVITPRRLGVLAAANFDKIDVVRPPKFAIIATGDELKLPGSKLGRGQITNSNSFALASALSLFGVKPEILPIMADNLDDTIAQIQAISGVDAIISTGGASVGKHDFVQKALSVSAAKGGAKQGQDAGFYKVAMRPGKPSFFGKIGDIPFFGLPGNPVSALVCMQLFVLPFLGGLYGTDVLAPWVSYGVLAGDLPENDERQSYWRARRVGLADNGLPLISVFSLQDSAMQVKLAEADYLLCQAPHGPALAKGDQVPLLNFPHSLMRF